MTSYVLSDGTGTILATTTIADDAMRQGQALADSSGEAVALHVILTHPSKAPKVGGTVTMKGIYSWFYKKTT